MPTRIHVIHASDFVRARPEGYVDMDTSTRILDELVRTSSGLSGHNIILDTRKAHVDVSAVELWSLAQKLADVREGFAHKTAVLCPAERFDRARFFSLCAVASGLKVRPFTSYEDAMEWLISTDA
jgi:hypothetical protein